MNIGVDAKRIFLNKSGLGSYGRNLMNGLQHSKTKDNFVLYSPKNSDLFKLTSFNKQFRSFFSTGKLSAFWRSYSIIKNLNTDKIDLYHGLSNELPFSLKSAKNIRKLVDIHDLLFLRFPSFYSYADRKIFEYKTRFACKIADKIIATSQATKQDIIKYYKTDASKIQVVYQSCDDRFFEEVCPIEKEKIRTKYHLPEQFLLCIGTIEERKNQLLILEAIKLCKHKLPLVLIGAKTKYTQELVQYAKQNNLNLILPNTYVPDVDLPAIYQLASIFVFPGLYEGFGIPVLEAMASKTPVISSLNTSMAEIIQNTECLINPLSVEDLSEKIDAFIIEKKDSLISQNFERALNFTNQKFAENVLKIYDEFRN